MSIAKTKNVNTNGKIKVSQGQWNTMAATNAKTDTKNNNQYIPLFLLFISIAKNFGKNRRRPQIKKLERDFAFQTWKAIVPGKPMRVQTVGLTIW